MESSSPVVLSELIQQMAALDNTQEENSPGGISENTSSSGDESSSAEDEQESKPVSFSIPRPNNPTRRGLNVFDRFNRREYATVIFIALILS